MASQQIAVTDGPDIAGLGGVLGGGLTDASGQFRIAGMRPGPYFLLANNHQKSGDLPVEVHELDVSGLTLVIGSGATLVGRVLRRRSAGIHSRPDPVVPAANGQSRCASGSPRIAPTARSSGPAFAAPGSCGLRDARGWWLKAVLRGDRDITDVPLSIAHGDVVGDLQVVFDDKPTTLSGSVADPSGAAVSDYTVIVFSADEGRWVPESRFIAAERPDQTGRVRIAGLPPGDYLVAAVEWVEEGQWLDPEFLRRLRPLAAKAVLEAGQSAAVELTLVQVQKSPLNSSHLLHRRRGSRRSTWSSPSCRAAAPSLRPATAD